MGWFFFMFASSVLVAGCGRRRVIRVLGGSYWRLITYPQGQCGGLRSGVGPERQERARRSRGSQKKSLGTVQTSSCMVLGQQELPCQTRRPSCKSYLSNNGGTDYPLLAVCIYERRNAMPCAIFVVECYLNTTTSTGIGQVIAELELSFECFACSTPLSSSGLN